MSTQEIKTALQQAEAKLQLAEAKVIEAANTAAAVEAERATAVVDAEDGSPKAQKLMADTAQKLQRLDMAQRDAAALVAGRRAQIEKLKAELVVKTEQERKEQAVVAAREVDQDREALCVALGPVLAAAQKLNQSSTKLGQVGRVRVQDAEMYLASLLVEAGCFDTRMFLADRRLLVVQDGRSITAPQRPSAEKAA